MKHFFAITSFLIFTLFIPSPLLAQNSFANTYNSKLVLVRIYWVYGNYDAVFDTDGESIANLSEDSLNKKFIKVKSAASVINFMTQNNYKVSGFSSMPGGIRRGDGTEFGGYTILFEYVK